MTISNGDKLRLKKPIPFFGITLYKTGDIFYISYVSGLIVYLKRIGFNDEIGFWIDMIEEYFDVVK